MIFERNDFNLDIWRAGSFLYSQGQVWRSAGIGHRRKSIVKIYLFLFKNT